MATIRWIQPVFDNQIFSSWIVDSYWENLMQSANTPNCRNIRLKNWSTTIRKWYTSKIASNVGTKIMGIVTNSLNDKLYVVMNKNLYSVNTTTRAYSTAIWAVSTTDTPINFVTYDKYTIILNGEDYPYLYDGSSLSQLGSWNITNWANAGVWTSFADFTIVAWTWAYANQLFISKPIVSTAITDCYDWVDATADIRTMKSNILGMVSTLDRLIVFCENSIEWLDRSTVATVWGKSVFYTKPIGEWDKLASHRSIVAAGDKIFFITKDNKIKTIDYIQGTSDLRIGNLSDQEKQSISLFMENLDSDQSESFWYFNKTENLIKRHVKSQGALFIDTVINYDLINKTFLPDDNKYFSCAEEYDKKYYCGGDVNSNLYQDEVWYDDDWEGISWYRRSKDDPLGNPQIRKSVRGVWVNWQINSLWSFNMEVYVDWEKATSTKTINWVGIIPWSLSSAVIWGTEIGGEAIGGDPIQGSAFIMNNFNWKLSKSKLRQKGLRVQTKYYGNTKNTILSLESQSMDIRSIGDMTTAKKL